jgi:hypothetical protein
MSQFTKTIGVGIKMNEFEAYKIWHKSYDGAVNLDAYYVTDITAIDDAVQKWVDDHPELAEFNTHVVLTWEGRRVYTLLEQNIVKYKAVRY